MPVSDRLYHLFSKHREGALSLSERVELMSLVRDAGNEAGVKAYIDERLREGQEAQYSSVVGDATSTEERLTALLRIINASSPTVHRVHFLRHGWLRYAAAIIILFGIGAYLWNATQKKNQDIVTTNPSPVESDIAPGFNRAVLTLSDGKQVVLDSAASETINDGALSIKNANGQLMYANPARGSLSSAGRKDPSEAKDLRVAGEAARGGSREARTAAYNTMSTPKGGQYKLTLADGTKVWLNAASSITYPTAFVNNVREVTVTGEAYFEVARNPGQPFVVKTTKEQITVLGTQFNVNVYPDEPSSKISLVEGAVKVNGSLLAPGQAFTNGKVTATNISQDVAWKNGVFNFTNLTIAQAARQIARWYDVEVQFDGPLPAGEIYGGVNRSVSLQRLIQGMDGEFALFRLDGKVLHIKAL